MDKLYNLKENLCDELEKYGDKRDLSSAELERIDDLADIVKNLGKIIMMYEDEGYSSAMDRSYARNGRGRGPQAERDARGRYSSRGYSRHYDNSYNDMDYSRDTAAEHLEKMLREEPDERKRKEIENMIDKLNRM
jgi:hypothetical protein